MNIVKGSKFLSLVLRHAPEKANITLDAFGWATVYEVLDGCHMSMRELELLVDTNDKKRFEFNEDKTKIRASQGHSVPVDLGYKPKIPPDRLFHGTVAKHALSIVSTGLSKMKRHHVHLSSDIDTALNVGGRRGVPIIFVIDAKRMVGNGYIFYLSTNGVWLTESVPEVFLCSKR